MFNHSILCVGANGQSYNVTIDPDSATAPYTVGSTLMLNCLVDPTPMSTNVMYSWMCSPGCFADVITVRDINHTLTDMDTSSMISCVVTIDGTDYTSNNTFDLQGNYFVC